MKKIFLIATLFVIASCQKIDYLPHPTPIKCGVVASKTIVNGKYVVFINNTGLAYSKEVWDSVVVGSDICKD